MRWLGLARRALDIALDRAGEREAFGAPLLELGPGAGARRRLRDRHRGEPRRSSARAPRCSTRAGAARTSRRSRRSSCPRPSAASSTARCRSAAASARATTCRSARYAARGARVPDLRRAERDAPLVDRAARGAPPPARGGERPGRRRRHARAGGRAAAAAARRAPAARGAGSTSTGSAAGALRATRIGAGHSNATFLLERGGRRMVLRRAPRPPLPPSAHDMLREARVLTALCGGERASRACSRCATTRACWACRSTSWRSCAVTS